MEKPKPISYIARKFIEENIDFAIARVIETKGSTPRKRGAALIMIEDGGRFGTVGGGLLEAKTEELCKEVLKTKKGVTYEFILNEEAKGDNALAMGCGGDARIQVDYIEAANPGNFVEEFKLKSNAYIFGGGHVAYALEPILRHVDFTTTIIDDREEYSNPERYPHAERTIVCDNFDHCFDEIETDEDSYIIIVTRGHRGDLQVLRQALEKPHAYIGMIGSKHKNNLLKETLFKEGVTQEAWDEVHAPIGLKIMAETPEEIGVSIAAEVIEVRAKIIANEMKFREVADIHAD
ncbi:MAG: XdhC/CoxI family protein [Bacillota bacterium]|nr:XdhC/CoxI family protein [Bacillota bacterium]